MDIGAVMDEVALRLSGITGLRAFSYPPAALVPPAAVVSYPLNITFGVAAGIDRISLPVVVVIGRPSDRSTRNRLVRYCNGSGRLSIRARLEEVSAVDRYSSFDDLHVQTIDFGETTINDIDYVSALFTVDIAGRAG